MQRISGASLPYAAASGADLESAVRWKKRGRRVCRHEAFQGKTRPLNLHCQPRCCRLVYLGTTKALSLREIIPWLRGSIRFHLSLVRVLRVIENYFRCLNANTNRHYALENVNPWMALSLILQRYCTSHDNRKVKKTHIESSLAENST